MHFIKNATGIEEDDVKKLMETTDLINPKHLIELGAKNIHDYSEL
jgi:hypothetical protein